MPLFIDGLPSTLEKVALFYRMPEKPKNSGGMGNQFSCTFLKLSGLASLVVHRISYNSGKAMPVKTGTTKNTKAYPRKNV